MVQDESNDNSAGEHQEGGTWVALKDAAALLDVSVDTVKRRMQRGELESRRETIPQGFRWLVRVDPGKTEAVESPVTSGTEDRGLAVPSADTEIVARLLHDLEVRNQQIAELHATLATLARALEHAEARNPAITATTGEDAQRETPPQEATESPQRSESVSLSVIGWLRRLLSS